MDFTRHCDVKCRQHAILALGNLCANPLHAKRLIDIKCMEALVSFSFPPTTEDSINAQFQAVAGLHGLSKQVDLRVRLLREGALEPLILGVRGNNRFSDTEVQREAAATLSNLALAKANRILIVKSGALPALLNLVKKADIICQIHAVTALANLAESYEETHNMLLNEQCLNPLCQLIQDKTSHIDIKRAVSRCLSLFASNAETHNHLLQNTVINPIGMLITSTNDKLCERFGVIAVANMALVEANHSILLEANLVESILSLTHSDDIETLRGVAFALHSFSIREENHSNLEKAGAVESLVTLLHCGDHDTSFQACLAIKYLCACEGCRNIFVESHGLEPLFALGSSNNLETKRELAAALRNISLSDKNKAAILAKGGIDIIATLCRHSDNDVSHQACGVIANVSEWHENKVALVEEGIIHHLQFAMFSKSMSVIRESIRAFANLSTAAENTSPIVRSGALTHLIEALHSPDIMSRRFAAMSMANLATNDECQVRIVQEHGILPLMSIVRQADRGCIDIHTQQLALACLANLAACHATHIDLINCGFAQLSMDYIKSSDLDIRTNALLCISNLASNRSNHPILEKCCRLQELIDNLECHNRLVQLRAVTSLRGLTTDVSFRKKIISLGGAEALLSFVHSDDKEFKVEVLSTLCNLSLGGCMGERAKAVLQKVDMQSLIAFLCNADSTHRLFGAVAIGNIASHLNLQAPVLDSGALQPLIGLSDTNTADIESQRCIAYAICNLSSEVVNRPSIITKGGLPSIMYLCHTGDTVDMLAALSTLRGLAASADARRTIFEEGVLSILSLAMRAGCLRCKREVAAILVLLSLNEENKFDLARSNELKEFIALTEEEDTRCVSQMCRSLGNISEVSELHTDILAVITAEKLIHLSTHSDLTVTVEVTRCCANLSSNFNVQKILMKPQMFLHLKALCSHSDVDIRRFSVLALANTCVNMGMHPVLKEEDLLSVFYAVINCDFPQADGGAVNGGVFNKIIESKCYACMAVSALCTDASIVPHLIEVGMVRALLKLLRVESAEMNVYVAFVFNKLSMINLTYQELSHNQVTSSLISNTQELNAHALTYSIAALRRLSDDENIRVEMIANDTVSFFAKFCHFDNIERCREIASSICHLALWDKARMHIVESEMFDKILELCKSSDVETSRFAIGSLANIAEDVYLHEKVTKKAGMVQCILRLTQSVNLLNVRESSRVLSNLLSSKVAQVQFLKEHVMASLVHVSTLQDSECM